MATLTTAIQHYSGSSQYIQASKRNTEATKLTINKIISKQHNGLCKKKSKEPTENLEELKVGLARWQDIRSIYLKVNCRLNMVAHVWSVLGSTQEADARNLLGV